MELFKRTSELGLEADREKKRWWQRKRKETIIVSQDRRRGSTVREYPQERASKEAHASLETSATFLVESDINNPTPPSIQETTEQAMTYVGQELAKGGQDVIEAGAEMLEAATQGAPAPRENEEKRDPEQNEKIEELFKGVQIMEALYSRLGISDDKEARKIVEVSIFNTVVMPFGIAGWVALAYWLWPAVGPYVLGFFVSFYVLVLVVGAIYSTVMVLAAHKKRREREKNAAQMQHADRNLKQTGHRIGTLSNQHLGRTFC